MQQNATSNGWIALLFAGLLTACSSDPAPAPEATGEPAAETATPTGETSPEATIEEAWISAFDESDNVDSLAYWQDAERSWVLATGKESHQLLVYDAQTGELHQRIAGPGEAPGLLMRPNGIMIEGDLVFVVERDNHRVQAFRLPELETVGTFGADVLRRPYGLTVFPSAEGESLEIYVTDNFDLSATEATSEPRLDQRVWHFRVLRTEDSLRAETVRAFGELEGPGALDKVETILADPELDRLLIAEELDGDQGLVVYTLDGRFTGEVLGRDAFFHEPEGVALRTCVGATEPTGYWIATDQAPDVSYFRVFDRRTFDGLGTFVGPVTANTDGVSQTSDPSARFPRGAFFAVHDDQGVTAFDWRDIAEALGLDGDC